jgi:hypothetical protein
MVKCSKCGTENELSSKFCLKCGLELKSNENNKNDNPVTKLKGWWSKKTPDNKIVTSVGGCCVGIILFLFIVMLFPVTSLSIEPTQVQIDNQTTEYNLKGKAEPNATVKITSPILNLNDVIINVDNDGNFSYKVIIPLNVTEADMNITAKSSKKPQTGKNVNIQRPLTPLSISSTNISSNATTLVVQGKTDPKASITLNFKDLNITDIQLTADENGNFNQTVNIPLNVKTTEIEAKANATGKRSNTQKIKVTREEPAPAPTTTTTNVSTPSSSPSASKSKFPLVLGEGDKVSCPECGSYDNIITNEVPSNGKYLDSFKCNNCGYKWDEPFSTPAVGTSI